MAREFVTRLEAGGGTALVGGNFQGQGPEQNASYTYMAPDAKINADAGTSGNGGTVIVWADRTTRYFGDISARGGTMAGDGGFAEVSGKESLVFRGTADLRAPYGKTGTLLLDPKNITIDAAGVDAPALGVTFGGSAAVNSTFNAAGIVNLLDGANLVLQANNDFNVNTLEFRSQIIQLGFASRLEY
jgi:hypothetical protein